MTGKTLGLSRAEWVLVLITLVWGGTFLVVKQALHTTGPMFFVGVRFAAAALVVAAFSARLLRGLTRQELKAGTLIGAAIALGYGLQTVGLQTITSSKSAFITAMYVPLVPLLQWLVLRRAPGRMAWIGIVLAFAGLLLLAGPDGTDLAFSVGEWLTLLGTLAMAGEILMIGTFANGVDPRRVTFVQLAAASVFAFVAMAPTGESFPTFSWVWAASALGLGVASAGIQLGMNWAQRTVSPTRATLIYAGEPVWAGLFGRLAGERLGVAGLVGGALIVIAVIASEWKPRKPLPMP